MMYLTEIQREIAYTNESRDKYIGLVGTISNLSAVPITWHVLRTGSRESFHADQRNTETRFVECECRKR